MGDVAWMGLVVTAIHILGVVSAIDAVMKARTAQGAIAWAISLITLPYLVLPIYLILGRRRFHGYILARRKGNSEIHQQVQALLPYARKFSTNLPEDLRHYEVLEYLAGMPFTEGNDTQLLVNGDAAFEAMFAAIDGAKTYVLVQFFIIRDDRLGLELKRRLKAKAAQGVRVYLLYDPIGCHALSKRWIDGLREGGVIVSDFTTTRGSNRFQIIFRNHRKVVIADGQCAFVGGLNVGDEYMGRSARFGPWRDTALKITGPAVHAVQIGFLEDFYQATRTLPTLNWRPQVAPSGDRKVLVLPTGPADELESCGMFFMHCINTAQFRLWICSPYFVPDSAALHALQLAALRGVDVRIMLPEKPDHLLVALSAFSYLSQAKKAGIKFFRYQPGFLHQKVMLVDDEVAVVGTANMDNRSFRLNFELSVMVVDRSFALEIESMLVADFEQCREVDAQDYERGSFPFKLAVAVARLLAPMQ